MLRNFSRLKQTITSLQSKPISQLFSAPIMKNRAKKIAFEDASSIWTRIQSDLNIMTFNECAKCVNELSYSILSPDLRSQEFKLLLGRIRFLLEEGSCNEMFELVEGLYRLKIDSLTSSLRNVVMQGKYMKSPKDVVVLLLFFG